MRLGDHHWSDPLRKRKVRTQQWPATVSHTFSSVMKVHQLVMTGRRLPIPSWVPRSVAEFISTCWREKPENRPSFSHILPRVQEMILEFITNGNVNDVVAQIPESLRGEFTPSLHPSLPFTFTLHFTPFAYCISSDKCRQQESQSVWWDGINY